MWRAYAASRGLPWVAVGTFEIATREDRVSHLETYRKWGLANGMGEDELSLLTEGEVRQLEPNVRCHGAIWSKTDTSVDYQAFTQALRDDAERAGARFLLGADLESIDVAGDHLDVHIAPAGGEDRVYVDPPARMPCPSRGRTRTAASSTTPRTSCRNSSSRRSATSSRSS